MEDLKPLVAAIGGHDHRPIPLTKAILNQMKSRRGAWKRPAMELLGVVDSVQAFEPPSGWIGRVLGKPFPRSTLVAAYRLRDAKLSTGAKRGHQIARLIREMSPLGIPVLKKFPKMKRQPMPSPEEKAATTKGFSLVGKITLDQYETLVRMGVDGDECRRWTCHRANDEITKRQSRVLIAV